MTYHTIRSAARLIGRARSTIYQALQAGTLPGRRVRTRHGIEWRIREEDLVHWAETARPGRPRKNSAR